MKHQDWQDLLPFYIANTLEPPQRQRVERHLQTCQACQQVLQEWRMIAAAVWDEADEAGRRNHDQKSVIIEAIQQYPPINRAPKPISALRRIQGQRVRGRTWFPLTMVAGVVFAVLFGAVMILLSLRDDTPAFSDQVALNPTVQVVEQFGAESLPTEQQMQAVAPQSQIDSGILPTPVPPTVIVLPTPTPVLPPGSGGAGGGGDNSAFLSNAPAPESAVSLVGPFITLTPGLIENGYQLCYAFNPTTVPLDVYRYAQYSAPIIGSIEPGQQSRTLIRSQDGWFQVRIEDRAVAWLPPETAYLQGSCDLGQFWIVTPTQPHNNDAALSTATAMP